MSALTDPANLLLRDVDVVGDVFDDADFLEMLLGEPVVAGMLHTHLPGKHDQRDHGRRYPGGRPSAPRVPRVSPLETAARKRQATIDKARARGDVLADVEAWLLTGADVSRVARTITAKAETRGVDRDRSVAAVLRAVATGDRRKVRASLGRAWKALKLERIGPEDDSAVVRFDPAVHELIDGPNTRPSAGRGVELVKPGTATQVGGERVVLSKAIVEETDEPVTAGVQAWGCGCDDKITTAAKRRTYVRDDLGRFDDVPGGGGGADKLRLQRWAPAGFTVRSSRKVKNENSDLGIAEVDGPDGPQIRIGVVNPDSGKWDGGFSGEARMAALREQIEQKQDDFENESDHDQAAALDDEIAELESELEALDQDRTAVLTPAAVADFRRQLGETSTLARANKAEQDAAAREHDALEKQRAGIIAEFGDTELEEEISQAQGHLWAMNYRLRLVRRQDSEYARYIPEAEADAAKAERDLAPLLAERAELMPPGPRVQLEELERRQRALNADDIDGIITSAEISLADGMRVLAEVWGSDDIDTDWVTTRFYVLAPGESTDDADNQGRDAQFRGLKGLNKLIAGFEPVGGGAVTASAAVEWGCGCPTTAAKDVIVRDGHSITVNRDRQGQFAEKAGVDLSKLKVPELRKLATARGLKGLSKATRPQLVKALSDDSVTTPPPTPTSDVTRLDIITAHAKGTVTL